MSAAKHTPGPWTQAGYSVRAACVQYSFTTVAICQTGLKTMKEVEANVRLIAAAPDLVFQLLAAANYIDALGGDSTSYRAAIARATA